MSEPMENHAISKLSNVDLNNHQCNHRRRFRRDREPSRNTDTKFETSKEQEQKGQRICLCRSIHVFFHVYPCHLQCILCEC